MSGGDKLFGGSNMNKVLLQNQSFPCSSAALESLWCPNTSTAFHGSKSVVTFGNINGVSNVDGATFQSADNEDYHEEDFDRYLHQPGKKRRLTIGQVELLEKNFEIENKLEPERKVQLAKELGLEPRQVAIWFQNRRARFKIKQLEKDYNVLKANYDKLKADYDILLKENDKLKNVVVDLKDKLIITESGNANQSSINYERIKSTSSESKNAKLSAGPEVMSSISMMTSKQEEVCSAKSDVVDSDSPHYTDGNHFTFLAEPAASSNVFEPEHSEFSPTNEDVSLSKSLLPPICCPRLGDESCNLGFQVEDILAFIN